MSFSGHHGGYKFDTVDGPICKGQKIVTSDEGTSGIAHAMTVVGYNDDIWVDINNNGRIDDGEKGAFRVADSYTGSGDNGFFWLAYDALNKTSCVKSATNAPKRSSAVSSEGFYGLILDDTSNDEAVYLEFTVNSSNRNEVEFKVTDTDENAEFTTKIYGLSSGAYSYAGTTTAADGKFVLDLSKYNSKFTREKILNDGIKFTISDTKYNYKNTIVKEVYLYDKATNTRIQLNDRYVYLDNESIELSSKGNNYTTIFYKGLTTPYIHYKVGNGQWTKAPGEKIGESNKMYGYYYAIKINLGNEDTLTACFNDGNGNWDNNDKKNYTFGTGCYTFNCGKITEVSDPDYGVLVTDLEANIPDSIVEGNTVIFNTKTKNARGTVKYKYVLTRPDGTQSVLRDYSTYNSISWLTSTPGMYTVTAYANDGVSTSFKSINYEVKGFKNVSVSSLTSSLGTEFSLGKTTTISMKAQDGYSSSYSYSIKVNGKEILSNSNQTSASFKPTEAGTYTVVATVIDARGQRATKTITLRVNEVASNQTTIYYKGYSNPYIHYKVGNGSWTNAPGVKMSSNSDVNGYDYAITIDLGDAEKLTACFNNGGSQWDNNGGKDYTFGVGTYTMSNGVITKIN